MTRIVDHTDDGSTRKYTIRRVLISLLCLTLFVGLVPIPVEVIPTYRLEVIDEKGVPIQNLLVTRQTKGFPLDEKVEAFATNASGIVEFPARETIWPFWIRTVSAVLHFPFEILSMGHVRGGVFIWVKVTPSETYRDSGFGGYYEGNVAPSQLRLENKKPSIRDTASREFSN